MNKNLFLFLITFFTAFPLFSEQKTLVVYTCKNVVSKSYGYGKELQRAFEKKHGVRIQYEVFNSSADMLMRLKLEEDKTKANVVLGLDYYHMEDAKILDLFAEHSVDVDKLNFPLTWGDEFFIPYEYGYLGFIYDSKRIKNPPKSFEDLINRKDLKIIISNPYTSIPGLGLVLWIKDIYRSRSSHTWRQLQPRILAVTKSWGQAYSLFHKGEANMMLSYTNDPEHLKSLGKKGFKLAQFEGGHYLQGSLVGIVKTTEDKKLANAFIETVLSKKIQALMSRRTWMYPVGDVGNEKIPKLQKIERTIAMHPKVVSLNRRAWVREWRNALSKVSA